jgi:hypothetical protein
MRESSTYQLILDEGRVEELQDTVLRQGATRFGPPPEATRTLIRSLRDLPRLRALADRVWAVSSWTELVASP